MYQYRVVQGIDTDYNIKSSVTFDSTKWIYVKG